MNIARLELFINCILKTDRNYCRLTDLGKTRHSYMSNPCMPEVDLVLRELGRKLLSCRELY